MKTVEVAPLSDLPEEAGFEFRSGPFQIALFRVGDEVRAIDNVCPHAGAALADGYVENGVVACPWHCWEFDTKTGACSTVEGMDVETYPTVIEDGVVKVQLPE